MVRNIRKAESGFQRIKFTFPAMLLVVGYAVEEFFENIVKTLKHLTQKPSWLLIGRPRESPMG